MDKIDIKLLKMLAENAECTAQEMSSHVHLSVAAINKRIAKLKADHVIERYIVKLNPSKVGKPIVAFVLLALDNFSSSEHFFESIKDNPDILECHAVTGDYDYLIKVCAKDISSLENILLDLKKQIGVSKTNTLFSLMEHKYLLGPTPD